MPSKRLVQLCLVLFSASTHLLPVPAQAQDSLANWKRDNPTFRIGISNDTSMPVTAAQFEGYRRVVAERLDMNVEVFVTPTMPALVDAVASGRIHYAMMTGLAVKLTDRLCQCAEPLAVSTTRDGAWQMQSVLFARSDAADSLEALKGKTVAMGNADNLTARLLPHIEFQLDGKDVSQAQWTVSEFDSADAMMNSLATGQSDAMFGWSFFSPDGADSDASVPASRAMLPAELETTKLWASQAYALGPHVVTSKTPVELRRSLRQLVLGLHSTEPLAFDEVSGSRSGAFKAVDLSDYANYDAVIDLIASGELKAQ